MDIKNSLKRSAEKKLLQYNLLNGTKEFISRKQSFGRHQMMPELKKYEKNNGAVKPEYLQAIK